MLNCNDEDILAILKEGEPISITRYGDGEAMVLNGFNDMETFKMVCKRQFGYIPCVEDLEAIRANLIDAYQNTDIIGIPVNKRLDNKDSYWYKATEILTREVGPEHLQHKRFTNIDVHNHFQDKDFYKEFLTGIDNLCYISCRNLDSELKTAFNIKNIESYIIAPEAKFTSGYEGVNHYPDQFKEIYRVITRWHVKGSICLVGAGVVGKIYCNWLRDLGGTAFDIGNVFDSWAGRCTRGPGRGLNARDNTYKL